MLLINQSTFFNNKTLLIFDFDGTLANTSSIHERAFCETLSPFGISVDYTEIAGMRTEDAIKKLFLKENLTVPRSTTISELAIVKKLLVRKYIANFLYPIDGVYEFLKYSKFYFMICIVTSGSRLTVELAMDKLGILGWFNPVFCSEDVVHAKPSPEGFLRALEYTKVSACNALVFEDSDSGFNAAIAAGIDFVNVKNIDWYKLKSFI